MWFCYLFRVWFWELLHELVSAWLRLWDTTLRVAPRIRQISDSCSENAPFHSESILSRNRGLCKDCGSENWFLRGLGCEMQFWALIRECPRIPRVAPRMVVDAQSRPKWDLTHECAHESTHAGWFPCFLPTKAPTKCPTKASTEVPMKVSTQVVEVHLFCFHLFCSSTNGLLTSEQASEGSQSDFQALVPVSAN